MLPIRIGILIAAAAGLASVIGYFLGSSNGKDRALRYTEKVTQILEKLHTRIGRFEELAERLRREKEQAEERARGLGQEGDRLKARIETAETTIAQLEKTLAEFRARQALWLSEQGLAGRLLDISMLGLLPRNIVALGSVVSASVVLSEHRLRPSEVLQVLDCESDQIDALAERGEAEATATLAALSAPI